MTDVTDAENAFGTPAGAVPDRFRSAVRTRVGDIADQQQSLPSGFHEHAFPVVRAFSSMYVERHA